MEPTLRLFDTPSPCTYSLWLRQDTLDSEETRMTAPNRNALNDLETKNVSQTPIMSSDLESGKLSLGFTCDADAYRRLYD